MYVAFFALADPTSRSRSLARLRTEAPTPRMCCCCGPQRAPSIDPASAGRKSSPAAAGGATLPAAGAGPAAAPTMHHPSTNDSSSKQHAFIIEASRLYVQQAAAASKGPSRHHRAIDTAPLPPSPPARRTPRWAGKDRSEGRGLVARRRLLPRAWDGDSGVALTSDLGTARTHATRGWRHWGALFWHGHRSAAASGSNGRALLEEGGRRRPRGAAAAGLRGASCMTHDTSREGH